jgi:hypothetical protein
MLLNDEQREDIKIVFGELKGAGTLDYVSAWYWKAAKYIAGTNIECAFVSTNSITQGEQASLLFGPLMLEQGIKINFAHQTFKWNNEGKGVAAVHCVIIGFACFDRKDKRLFTYSDIDSEHNEDCVTNINAYLVNAPTIFVQNRDTPISAVTPMRYGNMPRDGGFLIFDETEYIDFVEKAPIAKHWFKEFIGGTELINGGKRYVLWLIGANPAELKQAPLVLERIESVRQFRLASKATSTQKFAQTPQLFCQIAQPSSTYLAFPRHSSERRKFLPIAYFEPDVIASDALLTVENATLYHFAIVNSSMHNSWIRTVCGRLKSDYRYSKDIVYNNFVWASNLTEAQRSAVELTGQAILDARSLYPNATLADLYDPLTMPVELIKAHEANDKAVDAAYGYKGNKDDTSRVAFLFKLYEQATSLLPVTPTKKGRVKKTVAS